MSSITYGCDIILTFISNFEATRVYGNKDSENPKLCMAPCGGIWLAPKFPMTLDNKVSHAPIENA